MARVLTSVGYCLLFIRVLSQSFRSPTIPGRFIVQINEHSPLNVSYEQIKTGRKVTHIHFTFKEKSKSIEHKSEQNNFYKLTDSQINMFGNQLSRLHEVSHLAQQGESYDDLAIKIKDMLRDPIKQKQLIPHLKNLGFKA